MKILLVIASLLLSGIGIGYFTYQSPETTAVFVLRDVTDKHLAIPDSNEIIALVKSNNINKWNGTEFNYKTISNVSLNKVVSIKLETENKWFSNEIERDKKIKKFYDAISETITTPIDDSTGRQQSSVYRPLADALNQLSKSDADKKVLVVYSDLMENEPDLSFYAENTFLTLTAHPTTINNVLEKKVELLSLKGIEIYFIYQPNDVTADSQFMVVTKFYKTVLESKGATVHITSNLSI